MNCHWEWSLLLLVFVYGQTISFDFLAFGGPRLGSHGQGDMNSGRLDWVIIVPLFGPLYMKRTIWYSDYPLAIAHTFLVGA